MISIHAGQCGNQLGFCVLDSLYEHLTQPGASTSKHDDQIRLMNHFFRRTSDVRGGSTRSRSKWMARSVCIDTEPKVIHDCISRAEDMKKWFLNEKHAHYEYGGAGNNWAKGYQLCTGEFRDASMNSIRIELEEADVSPTLLIVHSIGGGTGSGLGTKMSEEIYDEFADVTKLNLAVMPYHFGEVVVQHYNSVLCLAKVADVADAVILFENEFAHELCVNMRGISSPTLYDINRAITAEVVPALLPKVLASSPLTSLHPTATADDGSRLPMTDFLGARGGRKRQHLLSQDIAHLCSHPNYKFLNIKNTPQTSAASVSFTYDSWSTIISSLQRMSDSGSFLDRKSFCRAPLASSDVTDSIKHMHFPLQKPGLSSASIFGSPSPNNVNSSSCVSTAGGIRNIATSLLLRGPDARESASQVVCYNNSAAPTGGNHSENHIHQNYYNCGGGSGSGSGSNMYDSSHALGGGHIQDRDKDGSTVLPFSASYPQWVSGNGPHCTAGNGTVLYSDHLTNGYQRSACLVSNGQAILPSLQRPMTKGANMFRSGAYVHQYETCGLETEDFVAAFRGLGSVINDYANI